jgi:hypothetical protein
VEEYVHRSVDGWLLLARDSGEGVTLAEEPATVLRLPLSGDSAPHRWGYTFGSDVYDVQVVFAETIFADAGTFPESRKLKLWRMDAGGCRCHSSAEAEFHWYARGVGLVKWVTGSRNYELVASSYLDDRATVLLAWEDSGKHIVASPEDTLIVQLPVAWDYPHRWRASVDPVHVLAIDGEDTYRDLAPAANGTLYGTYVARVSVSADAEADTSTALHIAFGLTDSEPVHEFEVLVTVR